MHPALHHAFSAELAKARHLLANGDTAGGFHHLERAHVLSQAYVWPHALTHWLMLKLAWQQMQLSAVAGQAVRILLGTLGSAVGVYPKGNTGGSNISMFKILPVAPDLQALLDLDKT